MPRRTDAAIQAKILRGGLFFSSLGAVLYGLQKMMAGSKTLGGFVVACFVLLAAILILDHRYWVIAQFLSISGLSIPELPFSSTELGFLVLISVYTSRLAIRKSSMVVLNRDLLVVFPIVGWMFIVFLINPVGLFLFGSNMIGGRFYFQIALGFLALLVLSTLKLDETDAKVLFYAIFLGMVVRLVRGVIFPTADPDEIVFSGRDPEVSTRYAFVICSSMYLLLFARWSVSKICVSPWKVFGSVVLASLTVWSGRRQAVGSLALVPLFRAFLTGKDRLLTVCLAFVAALFLLVAVQGDGVLYEIPKSAKRALAVVVPKYRNRHAEGIQDSFRREMREQARYVIRESPWLGRRGFAMNARETAWIHFGGGMTSNFAGHAYSGNWHSTWFAYAADFGIPCTIMWALFTLYSLRYAYRAVQSVREGVYRPTCCLYFAITLFVSFAFSYVNGHSASTSMFTWITYGWLLALVQGRERSEATMYPSESPSSAPATYQDFTST